MRHPIQSYIAAYDTGIGIEAHTPEPFAQDNGIGAAPVVGRIKCTAGDSLDAENFKEAGCHPLTRDGFSCAVGSGHHHASHAGNEPTHLIERAISVAPVQE